MIYEKRASANTRTVYQKYVIYEQIDSRHYDIDKDENPYYVKSSFEIHYNYTSTLYEIFIIQ